MVLLAPAVGKFEVVAQLAAKSSRRIAHHIQAAAFGWTVFRKCGHNHVATGSYSVAELLPIPRAIRGIGEKVKRGSVMPHVEGAGRQCGR